MEQLKTCSKCKLRNQLQSFLLKDSKTKDKLYYCCRIVK